MKKNRIVKIGVVGVDSGQLVICDPSYIDSEYKQPDSGSYDDHAHVVYKDVEDNSLWQYTYNNNPIFNKNKKKTKSTQGGINAFPGAYDEIIPKYGKKPNELIESKRFVTTDIDPTPHIPKGEFSYRGICKATIRNENQAGQLNFSRGHAGVAVAFRTGLGDGVYDVFAEIADTGSMGERIIAVRIELISKEELEQLR